MSPSGSVKGGSFFIAYAAISSPDAICIVKLTLQFIDSWDIGHFKFKEGKRACCIMQATYQINLRSYSTAGLPYSLEGESCCSWPHTESICVIIIIIIIIIILASQLTLGFSLQPHLRFSRPHSVTHHSR
jgi:hypothetical protein